eukprot:CAMPEP_0201250434 /NCGR_PEP_ID=MMETSP0852-20130820/63542_1 /ASSEMBLY_ACC=CAM_ASM_000632 /TAXON_ID=183588 /ORGANISM="Pseudo-nitzschia fraudulenta, Strain WWA7" /LENGTH=53 /DNA_ID=CAMNT_0047549779 /DNA_START=50 /DNA_END=207 /DNA_ORIENTATION=+
MEEDVADQVDEDVSDNDRGRVRVSLSPVPSLSTWTPPKKSSRMRGSLSTTASV